LDENLALYSSIVRADSKKSELEILGIAFQRYLMLMRIAMLTLLSTGMTLKRKSELEVSSEQTNALFLLSNEDLNDT